MSRLNGISVGTSKTPPKLVVGVWSPAVTPHRSCIIVLPHPAFCLFVMKYNRLRAVLLFAVDMKTGQHRGNHQLPIFVPFAFVHLG